MSWDDITTPCHFYLPPPLHPRQPKKPSPFRVKTFETQIKKWLCQRCHWQCFQIYKFKRSGFFLFWKAKNMNHSGHWMKLKRGQMIQMIQELWLLIIYQLLGWFVTLCICIEYESKMQMFVQKKIDKLIRQKLHLPYTPCHIVCIHLLLSWKPSNYQNFNSSLLAYKCWQIFMAMKQNKNFYWKKIKMADSKNWFFQLYSIQYFFCQIVRDWSLDLGSSGCLIIRS